MDTRYGLLLSLDLTLHGAIDRMSPDVPGTPGDVLDRLVEAGFVSILPEGTYTSSPLGLVAAIQVLLEADDEPD